MTCTHLYNYLHSSLKTVVSLFINVLQELLLRFHIISLTFNRLNLYSTTRQYPSFIKPCWNMLSENHLEWVKNLINWSIFTNIIHVIIKFVDFDEQCVRLVTEQVKTRHKPVVFNINVEDG